MDYARLKQELHARLDALAARGAEIEEKLSDPGDTDSEENAVEVEDDEVRIGIGEMTKQEILAIRQTLQRIDSGQYGTCSKCGKSIDGLRLELLPYTSTCVQCA